MNLNQQVTSLELSKKLKELGVKQESHWYWESYYLPEITTDRHNNIIDSKYIRYIADKRPVIRSGFLTSKLKYYSAYTVAELGELLPEGFESHKTILAPENYSKNPNLDTPDYCIKSFGEIIYDKNEANARAKMLIHLLENKLITL